MEEGLVTPIKAPAFTSQDHSPLSDIASSTGLPTPKKPRMTSLQLTAARKCCGANGRYATSFCRQWFLLMSRNLICLRRDRSLALMRLIIHVCIGLLVGLLYYDIGNDASMIFNNFRYIFMSIMFLMFTAFSTMTIICKFLLFFFFFISQSP